MLKEPHYFDVHTHATSAQVPCVAVQNVAVGRASAPDGGRFYTTGIHPWYYKPERFEQDKYSVLSAMLEPQCLGVGECGLDTLIETPLEVQMEVFRWHIEVSEQVKKPVIVHCVKAFEEVLRLRQMLAPRQRWLIHGFRKNKELARRLLAAGFDLSVGAYALRPKPALIEMIQCVPIDRLHLETDHSGEEIDEVYRAVAQIRNMTEQELMSQMQANWCGLFGVSAFGK